MLKIWEDPHNIKTLVNRPALGVYPGVDWPSMLKDILLSVAPKGLDQVSKNFQIFYRDHGTCVCPSSV
jgi:4-aminobutyrate aminotransferase/(S)-3-amino-2-methylpropionate transaminase